MDKIGQDWIDRNLSAALEPGTSSNGERKFRCLLPGHKDKKASASININTGHWYCHRCEVGGGICTLARVLGVAPPAVRAKRKRPATQHARSAAATASSAVQKPASKAQRKPLGRIEAVYDYPDVDGRVEMQVCRFPGKEFRQRQPRAQGKHVWRAHPESDRMLYRLPDLAARTLDAEAVLVTEGEKDADAAALAGAVVTTNPGGGEKWRAGHSATLAALDPREVVIVPDADAPGQKHAWKVVVSLREAGIERIRVAALPYPVADDHGSDLSDLLDAQDTDRGRTLALRSLVGEARDATDWMADNEQYRPKAANGTAGVQQAVEGSLLVATEKELADLFVERHGDSVRRIRGQGWRCWNDHDGWSDLDEGQRARRLVSNFGYQFWSRRDGEGNLHHNPAVGSSARLAGAIVKLVEADLYDQDADWNTDRSLVGLPGCLALDLRTGTTRPQTQHDRITRTLGCVPAADWRGTAWSDFLECKVPDPAERLWLQCAVGCSATGHTSEEMVPFIFGQGSTGKSTFIETIAKALGEYARRTSSRHIASARGQTANENAIKSALAMSAHCHMLIMNETTPNARLDTAMLNEITGGDTIEVRRLHHDPIQVTPRFCLWLVGNHKPRITGKHDAVFRRLRMIEFRVQHMGADMDIALKASLQRPARLAETLAWIAEGARIWHESGMPALTAKMEQALVEYQTDADVIGQWHRICCVPAADPSASTSLSDLHASFVAFVTADGGETRMVPRTLAGVLRDTHRYETFRERDGTRVIGIALVDPPADRQAR